MDGTTGSSAAPLGSPRPLGTAPAATHPSLSRWRIADRAVAAIVRARGRAGTYRHGVRAGW